MKARNDGKTQMTAAAKAGISERTGRKIEEGQLQAGRGHIRHWRTRKDSFAQAWDDDIVPMLSNLVK
jgi:hypothetical protein